jgi:glycine/D-amino acid oxidase-like deaminating enzyme
MASAEVVIAGAGIAGIATAHRLAVELGVRSVVIADDHPPMTVTSDKSTECYRNFWPGPDGAMVALMNRSLDRLEALAAATGNRFRMNRRGYLYVTGDPARIPMMRATAALAAEQGAGPARERGYVSNAEYAGGDENPAATEFDRFPAGTDLVTDPAILRHHFPALAGDVAAALHVRRAGWFSGQELGMQLLGAAIERGVRIEQARVVEVERDARGVAGVRLENGTRIASRRLVLAAGPWLRPAAARLAGAELPIFSELHTKVAFHDHLRVVPRDSPLLIWSDPQALGWTADERTMLAEESGTQALLGELPPGAHTRPEGGGASDVALMLWAYDTRPVPERWPPAFDPIFPEVVLRGLTRMLPGLAAYIGHAPQPIVDGGYYTKTLENRPLIGPLPIPGAYVIGAFSGYGLMVASAAAELLSAHITTSTLPDYAPAFSPARYADPAYAARFAAVGDAGQL